MTIRNSKKKVHLKLIIFFGDELNIDLPDFNLIVQLLDVTFEDVYENIIFETKENFDAQRIVKNKLYYEFNVELERSNKIYSIFILVDIDKNGKISIGDYISMDRHDFTTDSVDNISINVYKVTS
jgi:hypothetical protein